MPASLYMFRGYTNVRSESERKGTRFKVLMKTEQAKGVEGEQRKVLHGL
jgi:hypothetical protein